MTGRFRILCCLAAAPWAGGAAGAQGLPAPTCGPAIAASERAEGLPPQMLRAIGVMESGRTDPRTGVAAPWPWTINVAGAGRMFDTAGDAIAAVQAAQAGGVQSIDVGCMQINLLHHPHAFATLQDAFDPATNVRYAAGFLSRLHGRDGAWGAAIAAYHSSTPALGLPYARTVALLWPLAGRYGMAMADPAASTRATLEAEIDPDDVLTPEFRARLVEAALQHRRTVPEPAGAAPRAAVQPVFARLAGRLPGQAAPRRDQGSAASRERAVLEDEVDPQRVLTPAFRAEMVAAARDRRGGRIPGGGDAAPGMPPPDASVVRRPARSLPSGAAPGIRAPGDA